MIEEPCTEKCRAIVYCERCEKRKAPIGRSVPLDYDFCDSECPAYRLTPYPPHLWPGECLACSTLFMRGERRECAACIEREKQESEPLL